MPTLALTRDRMLDRSKARDARFDGRFLVGVVTTGIYCRPSCKARKPRDENVRFFATPREAQAFGLRACRRCRPDDVYAGRDPEREGVESLARQVIASPGDFADVASLTRALGVGPTKLAALFRAHYHRSPAAFLVEARVRRACELLRTTRDRVLDVALEAGFATTSAFHANFRRCCGLEPTAWRRLLAGDGFVLDLSPGFRIADALAYHGRDEDSLCERVDGRSLQKTVTLPDGPACLSLELAPRRVRVRVEAGRRPSPDDMAAAHAIAIRLLHLTFDPRPFERQVSAQPELARLVAARPGLRVLLTADPFESLVWAIVGQQVNLRFAYQLRRALVEACGTRLARGLLAPPTPAQLAELEVADLARRQFSRRKAEYLLDVARLAATGELPLAELAAASSASVEARLRAVRGIGPWAATYVLMRGYGFADCVPEGDVALARAVERVFGLAARPAPGEVAARLLPFAPWRSLAAFHLWCSLGDPA